MPMDNDGILYLMWYISWDILRHSNMGGLETFAQNGHFKGMIFLRGYRIVRLDIHMRRYNNYSQV